MSPYTIYDPADGRIIRSGYCQTALLGEQADEGQLMLPVRSNPRTQKVDISATPPVLIAVAA